MPLIDANLAASWGAPWYSARVNGQTVGYVREAKPTYFGNDHLALLQVLRDQGLAAGDKVAVIGGGFGWMAEDWIAAGVDCYVTDSSTWVQTNKGVQATLPILNETCLTLQSRKNVLAAAGLPNNGRFRFAVTEDVLPWLTDNECTQLSSGLRNFATTVVHWLTPLLTTPQAAGANWKTLSAWKTLVNPDLVVARSGSVAI